MAKCIKNGKNKITRVSNDSAFSKVKGGKYTYCSKTDWKKEVRTKE